MLIKEAGYSLRDIKGGRTRTVRHEERTDLLARVRRWLPFCADPAPRRAVDVTEQSGMGEQEVLRRLIYHDEIEQMKEDEIEDEQKKAQRESGNIGASRFTGGQTPTTGSPTSTTPSGATGGKSW